MTFRFAFAALALVSASVPALAAPTVPPLAFTERTLPNGLRVYSMPDRSATTVSIQVWYDVGSKDDPRGRSGFAHLFEHLMFKATRNLPPNAIMQLTEDVGGDMNASTDDDFTEYHETVPANHLERLIWAESERMGALVIDQPTFVSERDVVKEELRSDAARPYDSLFRLVVPMANYTRHPYARPGIGNIAELDSATVDDVRGFHALYYRPDNAVLVVSGNFAQADLDRYVDTYLGPIAKPNWAIPRQSVSEPARTAPVRYTVHGNAPLPAVVISYPIPPSNDPDHAAITVLNAVLAGGESARFYKSLVYRDQIATEAGVFADFKKGPGLFSAYGLVAGGHSAAEVEAALRREIAAVRDRPVSAEELTRVRNQVVTSSLKARETAEGRASTLAANIVVGGDPNASDKRLAAIEKITAADIQRVARRILDDNHTVTITYLPEGAEPKGDTVTVGPEVVTAPLVAPAGVPVVTAVSDAERVKAPAPGPAVAPLLPTPIERKLANGLRLVVIERHAVPIVTAYMVVPGGSSTDPRDRAGVTELMSDLMTKGTTTRSATDIAQAIETLGGGIGGDTTRDGELLSLTVKSDELAPALNVFADVALHPAFAQGEIDRLRVQAIDGLKVTYASPGGLASLVASRAVYGDGPYSRPTDGTPTSLRAIQRADVDKAYRGAWRPDAATLVMAGDITADKAEALANSLFGGWRAPPGAKPTAPAPGVTPAPRTIVIDLAGAPQSAVIVARPTITRSDPRYYPMIVANSALGGGFNSRLNQEVRVRRGLAYGAGSSFQARRSPGPISASTQTKNPTVPDVIDLLRAEMTKMGSQPLPQDELDKRKAALTGGFGREIETTDGIAGYVAGLVMQDVPLSEMAHYAPSVDAVTAAQILDVSRALIDPAPASIVAVGDAKEFLPKLTEKGLKPEVIPADKLNLDSPTLR